MRLADLATEPLLVLAPIGRDAATIAGVLAGMGVPVETVPDLPAMCDAVGPGGGAHLAGLIIAEEALLREPDTLKACLAYQPTWSDLPIVLLTAGGGQASFGSRWALFESLGNVTLLSRPLHAETLKSAARNLLRSRARQYEGRRHLEALRVAAETLEARVRERTGKLMKAEEALRQAQKMEAIGQLTGGLAHDFNNMLTGITGSLELLRMRLSEGRLDDLDRHAANALAAADRAAALTHRLLAFSRRQTLAPKPIRANRLIAGMEELIRRTVGPQVLIRTVLRENLCPILCDPNQLENALLNLSINARDAMRNGGELVIETAAVPAAEVAAQEGTLARGDYVAISVTDTGTGMPPEVIARAFDPFFTTKPLGQGTGLGLSMIYGFAKQSGGEVRIASAVGRGTTVSLYLPCHDGELEEDGAEAEAGQAALPASRATILVVDDEAPIRTLLRDLLENLGYSVLDAEHGAAGLEILRSGRRINLVVSDIGLPGGMNGRQMVEAARADRPDLKVIFITGYAEQAVLPPGMARPDTQIINKPFRLDTVLERIRLMLAEP